MEKKIKTLYILSIAAILAFLGMQVYWLYGRYEYTLSEYENISCEIISNAIAEYNNERAKHSVVKKIARTQSSYQMNTDVDSVGNRRRNVTVTTKEIDGRKLLGIAEKRDLTPEEIKRLQELVLDSIDMVDAKIATVDASSAPSDGIAWNAMRNFDSEIQSPFTTVGIDSILRKSNHNAEITLILLDSVTWEPVTKRHSSVISPRFSVTTPYSELERKAVVIECEIPSSEILRSMGWTLVLASVISLFLILCLVWQIKTIVRLTRLDRMRNMFITTMIHELKRPISTLKMCVSGIENEKMLADKDVKAELMTATRNALDNLSAYFSKLRDITFNRVEQIPLNIVSFNLAQLVSDVVSTIQKPSGKTIAFENRVKDDIQVSADRSHLFNIINNLIENSIKYSGDTVSINVGTTVSDNEVSVTVTDTGNGIPLSDQSKIFTRFYRGRAVDTDIPGMGLGLSYVKLLVEAHGGSITVDSIPGAGTSFTFTIPQ